MKLYDFCEAMFAKRSIEINESYSLAKEAEMQAANTINGMARSLFKFIGFFKLLFQYIFIQLGWATAPKTKDDLLKEMKEEFDKKRAAIIAAKTATVEQSTDNDKISEEDIQALAAATIDSPLP